jgi:DNA-binding response OmpR family regulator
MEGQVMTDARPILLVEDDPQQRELLAEYLATDNEFAISMAATLREADELLDAPNARFDTIVLDLGMPDGDGRDYCAKLRRRGHTMPIIIVTGSNHEADIVGGLDAGANDYITKPVRMSELLARLRAQLRSFDNCDDAVFTVGQYAFRPSAKILHDREKNRRLHLTEKETAILKFLYRAGARSVARPTLLEQVWGYNARVTTHTLETHIYRLRQKLEHDPADCRLLVTEDGGYRLVATAPSE